MSYPGGKGASGVVQQIVNQMPPHDVYIEAFAGSAAVFRGKRPARANYLIELDRDAAASLASTGSGAVVIRGCVFENLPGLVSGGRALVYADPPYLRSTRTRDIYRFEMTDEDHRGLCSMLASLDALVVLSGYQNKIYDDCLPGWRKVRFNAMTRGGVREEVLWCNFPEPAELHDYQYVGVDRRDRQRIKRKIDRWRRRLVSMPEIERNAILSALDSSVAGSSDAAGVVGRIG